MDDATVEAKLAEIPKVDYDRIGERMYTELVYVNCDADADADKYVALVQKAAGLGRTLVLGCTDVEIAKAAVEVCKDSKPVLNGANASNYEAMNAVATAAGVVLGVSGKDLNELYDTVAALEKLGNKNLVLDVTWCRCERDIRKCCSGSSCSSRKIRTEPLDILPLLTLQRLLVEIITFRQHLQLYLL